MKSLLAAVSIPNSVPTVKPPIARSAVGAESDPVVGRRMIDSVRVIGCYGVHWPASDPKQVRIQGLAQRIAWVSPSSSLKLVLGLSRGQS